MLDMALDPNPDHVVGYFARTIMRDLRLVGGFDVLFGKLKRFLQDDLFNEPVHLDDLNILRNPSEPAVTASVFDTTKVDPPKGKNLGSADYTPTLRTLYCLLTELREACGISRRVHNRFRVPGPRSERDTDHIYGTVHGPHSSWG